MLNLNLTAAKMIGNYAKLEDNTSNFISSLNFQSDFSIQRLGISDDEEFLISIIPVSSNINNVSSSISVSSAQIGEIINDSFDISLNESIVEGDNIIYKYVLNNGLFDEEIEVTKIYGQTQIIVEDESDNYNSFWDDSSCLLYTSPSPRDRW